MSGYVRIAFFRREKSGYEVFMQQLDNGNMVFPGGKFEMADRDFLEAVIRELSEETEINRSLLRDIKNFDLLWGSRTIQVCWKENVEVIFIAQWFDSYAELLVPNTNDEEIVKTEWVSLNEVSRGKYDDALYTNVKESCIHMIPIISSWENPAKGVESVSITPEEFRGLVS